MMRGAVLVVLMVGGLGGTARADADADAVTKLVQAQVKAIGNMEIPEDDPITFAGTIADSAFVMLPSGYAATPADAEKQMHRTWCGHEATIVGRATKVVVGHAGDAAWVTADVKAVVGVMDSPAMTTMYRLTELLVRDRGAWKARAMLVSEAVKDEPQRWAKAPLDQDRPPGTATAGAPMADWLAHTGDLAAHVRAGADVVVLGSAPGERGDGPRAAALLGQWKKLAFAVDWTRAGGDGKTYAWLAGRVSRTATVKGAAIKEPYWVLALAVMGAKGWEVVAVHYAQGDWATPRADSMCDEY
jgi:hypothetical protein